MVLITKKNWGGWWWWGWWGNLPYNYIKGDQNIDVWNYYWVDATNWEIILALNDWSTEWELLTVKKLDDTDYSVFVNTSSLIDWESSIEISMEWESYDFYWTGSTFNIK